MKNDLLIGMILIVLSTTAGYLANRSRFTQEDPSPSYTDQDQIPTDIKNLDDFYNTEPAQNHDIRELPGAYSSFDAQQDHCFVIGAMVYNEDLYVDIMDHHEEKTDSFLRVVQNTVEGDAVLYDILYYEKTDKLYLVTDRTRDRFAAEADRKIELREFDNTLEYEYENHLYWILYRGEVNDDNFRSDDVFIITMIN